MVEKNTKGITLIVLVITIIILLILAGVTFALLTGENGILNKSTTAKNETEKQTATEIINLKITDVQIDSYSQKQKMPTLKELSLALKEDEEIEYINEEYNVTSDNPSKIYTKLKEYPYEFEIDRNLKLATIDGEKVDNNTDKLLSITENGEYDVSNYTKANVNVPTNIASGTKEIEETGEYDVSNIEKVIVKNLFTQTQYNQYGDEQYNKGVADNVKKIQNFTFKAGNHHYDIGFKPSFIFYIDYDKGYAWGFEGNSTLYCFFYTVEGVGTSNLPNTIVMDDTGFYFNYASSTDITVDILYAIK